MNDVDVGSSTDANGNVIFTYGAYNYSLAFDVTYADVGGCKEQIDKLREVVETPLLHVNNF